MAGHNYFRFRLRTTFIVMTALCLLFGYVGWEYSWITRRKEFLLIPDNYIISQADRPFKLKAPLLSKLFGDQHYGQIVVTVFITHEEYGRDPESAQNNYPLLVKAKVLFPEAAVEPYTIVRNSSVAP